MKGYAVLHWGISKSSPGEWLVSYLSLIENLCIISSEELTDKKYVQRFLHVSLFSLTDAGPSTRDVA